MNRDRDRDRKRTSERARERESMHTERALTWTEGGYGDVGGGVYGIRLFVCKYAFGMRVYVLESELARVGGRKKGGRE